MDQGQGMSKTNTERLIMNYDPEQVPMHSADGQSGLGEWA
jgi:hypothetical protein